LEDAQKHGIALSKGAKGVTSKGRPLIDEQDYYTKNSEFRVWLQREKKLYLGDLETEKAKELFGKFAKAWNKDKLDETYYKGIDPLTLSAASRTSHKWGFLKKMNEQEKFTLETMRDNVDTATFHQTASQAFDIAKRKPTVKEEKSAQGPQLGPEKMKPGDAAYEAELKREAEQKRLKLERKRWNEQQKVTIEELVPKKEGREARLEKRKTANEFHKYDKSSDMMEGFSDADLMGSSGASDFQQMLARRTNKKSRIQEDKAKRVNEIQEKEKERMRKFLESIGQADKYKI